MGGSLHPLTPSIILPLGLFELRVDRTALDIELPQEVFMVELGLDLVLVTQLLFGLLKFFLLLWTQLLRVQPL